MAYTKESKNDTSYNKESLNDASYTNEKRSGYSPVAKFDVGTFDRSKFDNTKKGEDITPYTKETKH